LDLERFPPIDDETVPSGFAVRNSSELIDVLLGFFLPQFFWKIDQFGVMYVQLCCWLLGVIVLIYCSCCFYFL
jgi:hypothetical protein